LKIGEEGRSKRLKGRKGKEGEGGGEEKIKGKDEVER